MALYPAMRIEYKELEYSPVLSHCQALVTSNYRVINLT